MAIVEVATGTRVPLVDEPASGHNRWHPDIAPVAQCRVGDTVVLDTRDAADGQLTYASTSADAATIDLGRVHPLTGPIRVEGARPGDLLRLEIEEVTPGPFGFTAVTPGFGFLRDMFDQPFLARWRLSDRFAVSPDIPGVAIPADPFLGIVGLAPSHDLLDRARRREEEALGRGEFLAPPTSVDSAVPAGLAGRNGLRTGPPRENGGNLDVRHLGPGAQVLLPVFVDGALFSVGDAHFAQGDGEVCGLAIETTSRTRITVGLESGGARRRRITQARLEFTRPPETRARRYFATTGLSIRGGAESVSEDATLAARNALLDMIGYLGDRGFTAEQAYALCSVAVDLRISQIVDVPHVTVSAVLPLDIFT